MSRVAYVNGRYVLHGDAAVHVEDRGYQFADGVYEVIAVQSGRLIDQPEHMERLERSLGELHISPPMGSRALGVVMREVVRRNRIGDGIIYLQITRGVARRDHAFPLDCESSLIVTARTMQPFDVSKNLQGVDIITIPDIRWKRRDIKTISLLPNILGKQQAREQGAYEAWMVEDDGTITEGTSSNAWIVTNDNELITRHADTAILNGITRRTVLKIAAQEGIKLVERPFTVAEAKSAREAFVTSTTSFIKPVIHIDGDAVGNGKTGPLARRLLDNYADHMKQGSNKQ